MSSDDFSTHCLLFLITVIRSLIKSFQESDMNGLPSLTLPSISEDDENAADDGEDSPLSPPNRSPLDAVSPRHVRLRSVFHIFKMK